jgi:hypothetical protein
MFFGKPGTELCPVQMRSEAEQSIESRKTAFNKEIKKTGSKQTKKAG